MSEYKLQLKGVCKSFPGVKALDNVQLSLRPGTVHALMGENRGNPRQRGSVRRRRTLLPGGKSRI